jgi:hypothetical protein
MSNLLGDLYSKLQGEPIRASLRVFKWAIRYKSKQMAYNFKVSAHKEI